MGYKCCLALTKVHSGKLACSESVRMELRAYRYPKFMRMKMFLLFSKGGSFDIGCLVLYTIKWYSLGLFNILVSADIIKEFSTFTVWCSVRGQYNQMVICTVEHTTESLVSVCLTMCALWKQRTVRIFTLFLIYCFFCFFSLFKLFISSGAQGDFSPVF